MSLIPCHGYEAVYNTHEGPEEVRPVVAVDDATRFAFVLDDSGRLRDVDQLDVSWTLLEVRPTRREPVEVHVPDLVFTRSS